MKNINQSQKLVSALEIYQKNRLAKLPSDDELKDYNFSYKFEKTMRSLIKSHKKPYFPIINTQKRRAAAIALVLVTAMSASLLNSEAFRSSNFILNTYKTFSRLIFESKDPEISAPSTIEQYLKPEYIPKDYVLQSATMDEQFYKCLYLDKDGNDLTYKQSVITGSGSSIDTEGTITHDIEVNGNVGLFFSNKGYNNILWSDSMYEYFLSGVVEISEEELLKIAESLK